MTDNSEYTYSCYFSRMRRNIYFQDFLPPLSAGAYTKKERIFSFGSKLLPSSVELFSNALVDGKATGTHNRCLPCKRGTNIYELELFPLNGILKISVCMLVLTYVCVFVCKLNKIIFAYCILFIAWFIVLYSSF